MEDKKNKILSKIFQKLLYFKRLVKFGIVGVLGSITNLTIFFIFVEKLKFDKNIISIICFLVAVTQNYILNHIWTFKDKVVSKKLSLKYYIKFVASSLVGLAVNLVILNIVTIFIPYQTVGQALGILGGMLFNFISSKFFVFRKKSEV
ncbi:MAG: hypothetical protein A2086_09590 [Spirochaetes bacterium GWD1_27_9]|nr:MAG: hypothetical protein A2Z98_14120 [Spirochaetes bacterium GWB1_27_13]OHD25976.1 MAG: hypothetical protein A2Y34_07020 [Spirochaetes bacterium GWC1_27_15]OHD31654.1 MAG: hypothetical protein A2086_09590 [Spirochaetes bacterium GWD1_27_9]